MRQMLYFPPLRPGLAARIAPSVGWTDADVGRRLPAGQWHVPVLRGQRHPGAGVCRHAIDCAV